MSEWWTYRLQDFLMFEPRTYYRLFERVNQELWPAPLVLAAAGLALAGLAWGRGPRAGRLVPGLLAGCWLWVAWAFHLRRYAEINLAAPWFAAGFALEALLLLAVAAGWLGRQERVAARDPVGLVLAAVGVGVWPLVAPLRGRGWEATEWFGLAPDPTAVATLGLVLAVRLPRPLLVIPVLWCGVSGLTLHAMEVPEWWLPPLLALLAVGGAARGSRPAGGRPWR